MPPRRARWRRSWTQLNRERREIEAGMQAQALAAVRVPARPAPAASAGARASACSIPSWHQGVVGLVASRVKERLRRPVVAFAAGGRGQLRGSARSVAGVHIRDVLDAMAARGPGADPQIRRPCDGRGPDRSSARGSTTSRVPSTPKWRAGSRALGKPDVIETDGELTAAEIALPTAEALRAGGPWGAGFPRAAVRRRVRGRRTAASSASGT